MFLLFVVAKLHPLNMIFIFNRLRHSFKRKIVNSSLPIFLAYVLSAQNNHLIETVLLNTQTKHMFWLGKKEK